MLAAIMNHSWAASTSDGAISEMLSAEMYCSIGRMLEGNLGLILGLVLVFIALWSMINGAKIVVALPFIILGALITALPSLVESTFDGLSSMLQRSEISIANFAPPQCSSNMPSESELKKLYTNPATGSFYPGHGTGVPVKPDTETLEI